MALQKSKALDDGSLIWDPSDELRDDLDPDAQKSHALEGGGVRTSRCCAKAAWQAANVDCAQAALCTYEILKLLASGGCSTCK